MNLTENRDKNTLTVWLLGKFRFGCRIELSVLPVERNFDYSLLLIWLPSIA